MQDYHQLEIWQRAMAFTVEIYAFSRKLPDDERFNLIAQLRRAATSVPLNIAEGAGCSSNPEFARFLSYAYRSLKEVITGLELCLRIYPNLATDVATAKMIDEGDQIARMIYTFMQRLGWKGPAVVSSQWSVDSP